MTLVEFLSARLDEDEAAAQEVHLVACEIHPQGMEDTWCTCPIPARVLAEVEAKRRIVEEHSDTKEDVHECQGYIDDRRSVAIWEHCPTLRLLALPYADHPDYDEEWKP